MLIGVKCKVYLKKTGITITKALSGWGRQAVNASVPVICALNTRCDHLLVLKIPYPLPVLSRNQ